MQKTYFEDCRVGDSLLSPGRTITETDIVNFAAFTGDWNRIHTDTEYARASVFGDRIAHGLLTVAVGVPLMFRPCAHALLPESLIAIAGMDKIRFVKPVKIGDTIRVEGEIVATTRVPREPRGLIEVKYRMRNQLHATVVSGRLKALVGCRPVGEPSHAGP